MIKHFIKTLLIFTIMIGFGLLGVYLLDSYTKSGDKAGDTNKASIAK